MSRLLRDGERKKKKRSGQFPHPQLIVSHHSGIKKLQLCTTHITVPGFVFCLAPPSGPNFHCGNLRLHRCSTAAAKCSAVDSFVFLYRFIREKVTVQMMAISSLLCLLEFQQPQQPPSVASHSPLIAAGLTDAARRKRLFGYTHTHYLKKKKRKRKICIGATATFYCNAGCTSR